MHRLHPADVEPFKRFIVKRMNVFERKASGAQAPWTNDPILQRYKFCNVYRELDRVTVWVREHWRTDYATHADLWFAMCVARLVNLPSTLEELRPLPWDRDAFVRTLDTIMTSGRRAFSGAYMVTTHGQPIRKSVFMADHILGPLWEAREVLRPTEDTTLRDYHQLLSQHVGLGSFLAAQVIADLKHVRDCPLFYAPDWWSWAAPGPGSLRGVNRIRGRGPARSGYRHGEWLSLVNELQELIQPHLTKRGWPELCAQDMQNCLCEFDKYERVRLGEGEPKQRYNGEAQ